MQLAISHYLWYSYRTVLDGEVAVPCNLQSAIAGLNSYPRFSYVRLPYGGGVEERVLCNANP